MAPLMQAETTSIQDELAGDHRRLERLFDALAAAVWRSDPGAEAIASAFERGLERHIRWEEEHLFPAILSEVPKDLRRHVDSLLADHQMLLELLKGVRAELARKGYEAARALLEELTYHLSGHNEDEELGAYRDADRHLEGGERVELIARFREPAAGDRVGRRP